MHRPASAPQRCLGRWDNLASRGYPTAVGLRSGSVERLLTTIRRYCRPIVAAAVLLSLAVAYLDLTLKTDVEITYLQFVSVAMVAWLVPRRWSVFFAMAVAALQVPAMASGVGSVTTLVANVSLTLGTFVFSALAVNELAGALRTVGHLARFDALTGVRNADYFKSTMDAELLRSRRYGRPFSVAFIDIDDFKTVNDTLSHRVGDKVLAALAASVSAGIRAGDVLGRVGGDEFALLLPEIGLADARALLERIAAGVSVLAGSRGWPVSISVGVTSLGDEVDEMCSGQDLLEFADALMFRAKRETKGSVVSDWFTLRESSGGLHVRDAVALEEHAGPADAF